MITLSIHQFKYFMPRPPGPMTCPTGFVDAGHDKPFYVLYDHRLPDAQIIQFELRPVADNDYQFYFDRLVSKMARYRERYKEMAATRSKMFEQQVRSLLTKELGYNIVINWPDFLTFTEERL